MKAFIFMALAGFAGMSMASQPVIGKDAQEQPAVKEYVYGMKLDIARVVSIKTDNPLCTVGPAWMTYEDSQGERHVLEYRRMGDGC